MKDTSRQQGKQASECFGHIASRENTICDWLADTFHESSIKRKLLKQ